MNMLLRNPLIRVCRQILSSDTGKHCAGFGGVFKTLHDIKDGTSCGYHVLLSALPQMTAADHFLIDQTIIFRQDDTLQSHNTTNGAEADNGMNATTKFSDRDQVPNHRGEGESTLRKTGLDSSTTPPGDRIGEIPVIKQDENIGGMFQDKTQSKTSTGQDFKDIESFIDSWTKPPVVKRNIPKKVPSVTQSNTDTYSKSLNPFESDDEGDVKSLNPFEIDGDESERGLNPFEIDDDQGEDVKDIECPTCYNNPFDEETMEDKSNSVPERRRNPFDDDLETSEEIQKDKNVLFSSEQGQGIIGNTVTGREDTDQILNIENTPVQLESCSSQECVAALSEDKEHDRTVLEDSEHGIYSTGPVSEVGNDCMRSDVDTIFENVKPRDVGQESSVAVKGAMLHSQEDDGPASPEFPLGVTSTSSSVFHSMEDSLQNSSENNRGDGTGHILEIRECEEISSEESGNLRASDVQESDTPVTSSGPYVVDSPQQCPDKKVEGNTRQSQNNKDGQQKISDTHEDKRMSVPLESVSNECFGQNNRKQNDKDWSSQNSKSEKGADYLENQEEAALGSVNRSGEVASSSSSSNLESTAEGDVVLVTGGNGFLGQHIIKMLHLHAPHVKEIRILDKTPFVQRLDYKATKPVKAFTGNITDSDFVRSAIKGVHSILHIAGLVSFGTFPDIEGMKEVNVNGTLNIVNACLAEPDVSRLVYCSTVDVVVGHEPIRSGDEDNTPVPDDFLFPGYPETKYQGERLVLGASGCSRSHGPRLQTLALRANVMYGELDPYYVTSGLKMAKQRSGVLTQIGDGSAMFQQAYVGNTAWAFVCADRALREDPALTSRFFYVPDQTPIQNSFNFMRPYLEARGFQLSTNPISYNFVYGAICAAEKVAKLVSPLKKLNLPTQSCSIAYINMDLYFKGDKAKEVLKYEPLFSPVEARLLSMKYYNKVEL